MHLTFFTIRCDTEEYDGPVVYAGGGSDVTNETVPTGPFGPQIPFILGLFEQAANLFNQGPLQAFPGVDAEGNVVQGGQLTPDINPNIANTQQAVGGLAGGNIDQNNAIQQFLQQVAGGGTPGGQFGQSLTPQIQQGINAQLGAGNNATSQFFGSQAQPAQDALSQIFGQDPSSQNISATGTQGGTTDASTAIAQLLGGGGGQNPFLDQLVQGAAQGQINNFQRNILPGISSEAQQAGQIGGSRQGIAEGIAGSDLSQQIANLSQGIRGEAFGTQVNAQSQALQNILGAQQGDQTAGIQAGGLNQQNFQQFIQSLLQGTGQVGTGIGTGTGQGLDAIGTGTAQAGNLFSGGNALDVQQMLGALGLIPGFQAGSLGQLGAVNQLGLQQFGLDQNAIDAIANQFTQNQNAPFDLLSQFQQFISGPFGSTVGDLGQQPFFQNPIPTGGQQQIPNFFPPPQGSQIPQQPPLTGIAPPPQIQPAVNPQQPPNPLNPGAV
jgi:hypothetical protein